MGDGQSKLSARDAARLARLAADPDPLAARQAARELAMLREEEPAALRTILSALRRAPKAALEGAGSWLFFPETDDELGLRLQATAVGEALLDLAEARPGLWWAEGLAEVVGLKGGRLLARLARLAKHEEWARAAVAALPPDTKLAGGMEPEAWLARQRLGAERAARARALARNREWPALAQQGSDELSVAHAAVGADKAAAKSKALAWPAGEQSLARLQEIAAITAREGAAAYELARAVSRELGRVVVLMGNASLGGPPLWGVSGPWVRGLAWPARMAKPPEENVARLAKLRAVRLAGPGLERSLWDLFGASRAAGKGARRLEALAAQATPWLEPQRLADLMAGRLNLSLGGPSYGPALERVQAALTLARDLERQGARALNLIYGLAAATAKTAAGRKPVVLPWADKFVASTLKDGDWAYLAWVVELLCSQDHPPVLLMVDETAHYPAAAMPGLLATAMAERPHLRLTGIGALGGNEEPADRASAVLKAAKDSHLVVVRPMPGPHPAPSLDAVLRPDSEAGPLAPASRDGASYLLAGTSLAPLAGHQCQAGATPEWLLTSRGFAPLGSWLRQRVRAQAGVSGPTAGPWQGYVRACSLG